MVTPSTDNVMITIGGGYCTLENDGVSILNTNALSSTNGYTYKWHDSLMNLLDKSDGDYGYPRKIIIENLSDCSLLALGDSTVDQDIMTQKLLDHFTSQGHTITLLGTLGNGTNKNEGRAGWKATDYFTSKEYYGVVNPFYNPSTQTFDFSYYMNNQGYSAPDFVVVQLGINDLGSNETIEEIWNYISRIVDSIKSYNSAIKVILNLPTTPNSDQSKIQSVFLFEYWNKLIRYNQLAITQTLANYGDNSVRCSYCHLILDPDTDIRDNVHPTDAGYEKMALEIVNQINCWQNNV